MAIALNSTSSGFSSGSTLTFAHTVSGANRILVVGTREPAVSGVTYNGVALTKAISSSGGSGVDSAIWYLIAPATGTNNIVVSATANMVCYASSWTGVDQVSPIEATAQDSTAYASNPSSLAIGASASSVVVDMIGAFSEPTALAPGGSQTLIGQDSGSGFRAGSSYSFGATSTSWTRTGGGSNVGHCSVALKEAATGGTITLTDVAGYRVIQRSGTTGSLAISGTHSGTASVQARVVQHGTSTEVVTWTTIDAAPGASTFSGTLTGIPQGSWYNIQVRNAAGVQSNGTNRFGVGVLVGIAGQSNGQFWSSVGSVAPDSAVSQYTASGWAVRSSAGSGANTFANNLRAKLGGTIPVAILNYAVSGTPVLQVAVTGGVDYWENTATGSLYDLLIQAVVATGGKLEALLWIQGESDGDSAVAVSQSTYKTALLALFARIRTALSQSTLPIIVSPLGNLLAPRDSAQWEGVRRAQVDVALQANNVLSSWIDDLPMADNVHLNASGYVGQGTRVARATAYALGLSSYARGPAIASASKLTTTTIEVVLTHRGGTDFTPTSGITGFEVLIGGSPVTLSSVARTAANKITITTAAAMSGAASLRYQYGPTPAVTTPAFDNSTDTLPIGSEATTAALTVSEIPTVTVTLTTNGSTAAASLTGLRWAIYLIGSPSLFGTLVLQGSTGTTDASGVFTLSLPGSGLVPGQTVFFIVTNSDGTATQSPAHKLFGGPVVVS